jgi:hypothetical protein
MLSVLFGASLSARSSVHAYVKNVSGEPIEVRVMSDDRSSWKTLKIRSDDAFVKDLGTISPTNRLFYYGDTSATAEPWYPVPWEDIEAADEDDIMITIGYERRWLPNVWGFWDFTHTITPFSLDEKDFVRL